MNSDIRQIRTHIYSVNPDETAPYEPSHQDFHCLFLIAIFEI